MQDPGKLGGHNMGQLSKGQRETVNTKCNELVETWGAQLKLIRQAKTKEVELTNTKHS